MAMPPWAGPYLSSEVGFALVYLGISLFADCSMEVKKDARDLSSRGSAC
jgi:hypothetical protein